MKMRNPQINLKKSIDSKYKKHEGNYTKEHHKLFKTVSDKEKNLQNQMEKTIL